MNINPRKRFSRQLARMRGFTILELLVVLAITGIVTAIAVPNYQKITQNLRIAGDLRDLNGIVAQAKMQAAANFTHARARANLAPNTFQLEIWSKTGGAGGAGCWQTVGDAANPCTVAASSVQPLSSGVTFGFDQVATPPPNTQAAIAQAGLCGNGAAGTISNTATIANTACIEFNSRGIPINAAGNPTGTGALYVNNGIIVYGLTLAATGNSVNWSSIDNSSNTSWRHQ